MKVSPLDVALALVTDGRFTPFRALSQLYSRAEFRTSISPTVSIDVASLDGGGADGESSWAVRWLRPTLVLSGPEGTKVIAPEGEAGNNGGLTGLLLTGLIVGTPFMLGYTLGQRKKQRR